MREKSARAGKKTKKAKAKSGNSALDHCSIDPVFEGMVWGFINNPDRLESVRELVLWRKVILQALFDFCSIQTSPASRVNQSAAARWFLENENTYFVVCELAEIDAGKLREIISRAWRDTNGAMAALRSRITRL